jgi:thioredoxin reductase (NADPH)
VLKPQLKRVLEELGGAAQGVEIDIEADQQIAQQAGVTGTPTVQLFCDKELKQQFKGVKQRSEFKAAIESLLGVHACALSTARAREITLPGPPDPTDPCHPQPDRCPG